MKIACRETKDYCTASSSLACKSNHFRLPQMMGAKPCRPLCYRSVAPTATYGELGGKATIELSIKDNVNKSDNRGGGACSGIEHGPPGGSRRFETLHRICGSLTNTANNTCKAGARNAVSLPHTWESCLPKNR